ncbi:MAG: nitrilase-related carbon-nitrogen hydrolase, partial [Candidatus Micrarchaeota archaeon]
MTKVSIGILQMEMGDEPSENLEKAIKLIKEASKKGAQIACLPELFTTRYFPQSAKNAKHLPGSFFETIPGTATEALSKAARDNQVVVIGGSLYEKTGEKLFNTTPVFGTEGELLGTYRKMHVPQDEFFFEQDYFAPGDKGFQVHKTKFGRIGALICYDQWFPEAARANALLGADILFYPTAIGTVDGVAQEEGDWQEAWENVMRGHAIANGVIVVAVNRVG